LQQAIAAMARESPQLLALRQEEEALTADYAKRLTPPPSDESAPDPAPSRSVDAKSPLLASPPPSTATSERRAPAPDNPQADYGTLRFRLQLNQLENVLDRIDGARIELAVSEAAFKYRYVVIRPAQVPRSPVKPNVAAVLAAGVVGALGLALLAVVAVDLLGGRILQTWQIERQLGLPALGVMRNL
jgi:hypothetical protein